MVLLIVLHIHSNDAMINIFTNPKTQKPTFFNTPNTPADSMFGLNKLGLGPNSLSKKMATLGNKSSTLSTDDPGGGQSGNSIPMAPIMQQPINTPPELPKTSRKVFGPGRGIFGNYFC